MKIKRVGNGSQLVTVLGALVLLALCIPGPAGAQLADTPWPEARQNSQRTNLSLYPGPEFPSLLWDNIYDIYVPSGTTREAIIIAPDGNVWLYDMRKIHVLDRDGNYLYTYSHDDPYAVNPFISTAPVLGRNGDFYYLTREGCGNGPACHGPTVVEHLVSVNIATMTVNWIFDYHGDNDANEGLALGPDGTIYFGTSYEFDASDPHPHDTNYIYAVNPDGSLKWRYETFLFPMTWLAVGADGTIFGTGQYYYTDNQDATQRWICTIIALNPDGTLKWRNDIDHTVMWNGLPMVAPDGSVILSVNGTSSGTLGPVDLVVFNPDGSVKWAKDLSGAAYGGLGASEVYSPLCLGPDGSIYITIYKTLNAFDPDGNQKWSFTSEGEPSAYDYHFFNCMVDARGIIYQRMADNKIHALRPDGSVKWVYDPAADGLSAISLPSLFAMDADGVIYFQHQQSVSAIWDPGRAPEPPTDLGYVLNPDLSIELDWTPSVSRDADEYNVYWDAGSGAIDYSQPLASLDHPAGSWVSPFTLTAGETYRFAVRCVDDYGNEETNLEAVSVTPGAPAAPTGLAYTPLEGGYARLDWVPSVSPDAALYNIYSDNGTGTVDYAHPVATLDHPAGTWTSPAPLDLNTIYKFGVRCEDVDSVEEHNTTTVLVIPKQYVVIPVEPGSNRVRVTLLEASAGLRSDVYMASPAQQLLIENTLVNVGHVSNVPLAEGDGLVFFIRVHSPGATYDHYSDSIFARISYLGPGTWTIGFEDMPAQTADWDFNDAVLLVELIPNLYPGGPGTNFIGEQEVASDSGDAQSMIAQSTDPSGVVTTVHVPFAALSSQASVILTNGRPENYQRLMENAPFLSTGVFRKVELSSGQVSLPDSADLVFKYRDDNHDGIVDGTAFFKDELKIFKYDPHAEAWYPIESRNDPANNQVVGITSHFSLFALGAVPGTGGTGGKHHDSANSGGWFGCNVVTDQGHGGGLSGMLPLLALGLALVAGRVVRAKRRRST